MAEFPIRDFAIIFGVIVAIGLALFYILKRLPKFMRYESPKRVEERQRDEAFNAMNSLSALVRAARAQGSQVDDTVAMMRESRQAYESRDYEGAIRTARLGKEVLMSRKLTQKKEIVAADEEEGEDEEEEETPVPAKPAPAPPRPRAPAPSNELPPPPRPLAANGGSEHDEHSTPPKREDQADAGGEAGESGEDEDFETPASALRRQKPRNFMEAKFMIQRMELFLTTEERAGRINKEARLDLEEAKRRFKDGDYDLSLALAAKAKRATGKTDDFVKVSDKEMPPPGELGTPGALPPPPVVTPAARAAARAPAQGGVLCSTCGSLVSPKDKFCRACGTPSARRCTGCGEALEPKDKFCGSCGAKC